MKEEASSELVFNSQETSQNKKHNIDKKRKIRKDKLQSTVIDYSDLRNIDTKKLTREERAKVQKAKNREAAQKSRDTHKEYVRGLENEVRELRDEFSRRLCWKCKQELQEATGIDSNATSNQTNLNSRNTFSYFNIQSEGISKDVEFPQHSDHQLQEQLFLRVEDDHSNSFPLMKYGLYLLGVVVVIVCLSYSDIPTTQSRALMELPNSVDKQLPVDKVEQPSTRTVDEDKNRTAIVKIEQPQHGLIALNNDDCLKSLMKAETPNADTQKSLTSYSDITLPQSYLSHQQGILLCQVRIPKPRSLRQNLSTSLRTPLVRLYLLGSQIKDLISNFNLLIPIRDSTNIQSNGIYQVLARIKQVNIVSNHNCLL